jgi:hypothetical protein
VLTPAEYLSGRMLKKRQIHLKIIMNANATKIPWSAEDDAALTNLKAQRSSGLSWCYWEDIGRRLQRSSKICRIRWIYALDPSIQREAWSTEEDAALRKLHIRFVIQRQFRQNRSPSARQVR